MTSICRKGWNLLASGLLGAVLWLNAAVPAEAATTCSFNVTRNGQAKTCTGGFRSFIQAGSTSTFGFGGNFDYNDSVTLVWGGVRQLFGAPNSVRPECFDNNYPGAAPWGTTIDRTYNGAAGEPDVRVTGTATCSLTGLTVNLTLSGGPWDVSAPGAPTIGSATGGEGQAEVSFTAPEFEWRCGNHRI